VPDRPFPGDDAPPVLRDSRRLYANLMQAAPDPVIITDRAGCLVAMNPAAERLTGYRADELRGRNFAELGLLPSESLELARRGYGLLLGGQESATGELALRARDGTLLALEAHATPLRDRGAVQGVLTIFRDVTRRRQMEESLRRSEERYRTILESIEDGYYEVDLEGRFTLLNRGLCEILGYERNELLGMSFRRYLHPANARHVISLFKDVYHRRRPLQVQGWEVVRKDGGATIVEASITPILDLDGDPVGFRGIVRDVSRRMAMERELKESEAQYRHLFEEVPDGLYQSSPDGRILAANPALLRMAGFDSLEEFRVVDLATLYQDPAERERWTRELDQKGEVRNAELHLWRKNGEPLIVLENARAIRDGEGRVVRYEGVLTDITAMHSAAAALQSSEERYRDLVENLNEALYALDAKGCITYISPVIRLVAGYAPQDMVGRSFFDYVHPDDLSLMHQNLIKRLGGCTEPFEFRVFTKDRKVRWVRTASRMMREGERVTGLRGMLSDITERKEAEEALLSFRKALDDMQLGVTITDRNRRIIYANRAEAQMHGYTLEELLGREASVFGTPEALNPDTWKHLEDLASRSREAVNRRKDGTTFPVHLFSDVVRNSEGRPIGVVTLCEDISERKAAEEALRRAKEELELRVAERTAELRRSKEQLEFELFERLRMEEELRLNEEKYRQLFEQSRDAIYITSRGGQIMAINPAGVELLGYSREEMLEGQVADSYVNLEDRDRFQREIERQGFVRDFPTRYRRKDGVVIDCLETASLRLGEDGAILGYQGIIRDITAQLRAEEGLRKRREALQAVHETSLDVGRSFQAICEADLLRLAALLQVPYAAFYVSEGGQHGLAAGVADGRPDRAVFQDREEEIPLRGVLQQQGDLDRYFEPRSYFQTHHIRAFAGVPVRSRAGDMLGTIQLMDGRERTFDQDEIHLMEIFAAALAHEVEQMRLQERMAQLQRVQLLGQITAGVAHEVRNPINAILAMTEALALDLGGHVEYGPLLEHIKAQVSRLGRLMQDLLELGKPARKASFIRMDLTDLCADSVQLWRESNPRSEVEMLMTQPSGAERIFVWSDGTRLQQVFINLLDNAAQHTPPGGRVLLEVLEPEGGFGVVRVVDQGPGIPEADRERVFAPFFTTRKKGTGLGLSIVKHIVEAHEGLATIANNDPPPGLTAEVRLPLAGEAVP
jgi:PAS domain S-box-containing protein